MNVAQELDKINYSKKIKLRAKTLQDGSVSLFLDLWFNNKRQYQFLKIHLGNTLVTEKADFEKLKLASLIRDRKEMNIIADDNDFELYNTKLNTNILTYFRVKANMKKAPYYKCMVAIFEKIHPNLTFRELTQKHCEAFYQHLLTVLSQNSAAHYMILFRHLLTVAKKDGLIKMEMQQLAVKTESEETKREFLSFEEVKRLAATPKPNLDICNAFLFSCFTGLRLSDIRALKFDQIKDGYIEFRQIKTGGVERMKLNQTALAVVATQATSKQAKVFQMPTAKPIGAWLKQWTTAAGIKKHITFHCARHTFATLCLTNDIDIYTVSKLLGHRDIKTTQIYAKLIDKKKDEAIDKLPEL